MNISIPEIHKANQVLWLALLIGAIIITGIFAQMNFGDPDFLNFNNFITSIFTAIASVITLLSVFLPNPLVRNRIENSNAGTLSDKFAHFRADTVFKSALHEGPALICAIFMHLEGNFYFIFLVAINLIMLFTARPTIKRFKDRYKLSSTESEELNSMEFLPLLSP